MPKSCQHSLWMTSTVKCSKYPILKFDTVLEDRSFGYLWDNNAGRSERMDFHGHLQRVQIWNHNYPFATPYIHLYNISHRELDCL